MCFLAVHKAAQVTCLQDLEEVHAKYEVSFNSNFPWTFDSIHVSYKSPLTLLLILFPLPIKKHNMIFKALKTCVAYPPIFSHQGPGKKQNHTLESGHF